MTTDKILPTSASLSAEEKLEEARAIVDELEKWTCFMSYNDSYVGEPPGHLKSKIRALTRALYKPKANVPKEGC